MPEETWGPPEASESLVFGQRVHRRVRLRLPVAFMTEGRSFQALTDNVSEGGLFVETLDLQPPGATLRIYLGLPDGGPPLDVMAEVRWVREIDPDGVLPAGMGVGFVNATEEDRRRVRDLVLSRARARA